MLLDVAQFVRNCYECKRADIPRDKTPGFLHLLLVLEHPWQHVTIDFKLMPKDKHRFDMVFVVIDRLSKQAISEPCHKTVTAKEIAQIYIQSIYRYYRPLQSIVSDHGP